METNRFVNFLYLIVNAEEKCKLTEDVATAIIEEFKHTTPDRKKSFEDFMICLLSDKQDEIVMH